MQFEGNNYEYVQKIHVLYMFRILTVMIYALNRESNGTDGDDATIRRRSFTDLTLLPTDESLELFVSMEERVELGEGRHSGAAEVVLFVVVVVVVVVVGNWVGEGVVEDVVDVVCVWVRLGGWTGVGVWVC